MALLWVVGRLTRHTAADSRGLAFALPQAGEFGFVLFSLAVANGVMEASLADLLVIVVTISMIASPLLMMLRGQIESRLSKEPPRAFDLIEARAAASRNGVLRGGR
jgi:glutathione-regulated potassium-efflux system ancillary protein KefC/glutathione-regulated potassium-efflux system protein KefB